MEKDFDKDGWCRKCNSNCEMIPLVMVDEMIYKYAVKHGMVTEGPVGPMFSKSKFESYFRNSNKYKRAPIYVKKYLSTLNETGE